MTRESLERISGRLRIAGVVSVLLCLFAVPLLFLVYGSLAAAIGGVGFVLLFAVVQLPIILLLRSQKLIPNISFGLPDSQEIDESESPPKLPVDQDSQ